MKKLLVSIVLLSYFALSTGVIVNFHYCMNRFASADLFVVERKECPKCGMHIDESHGCCRDEVQLVKIDDDQKVNQLANYDFAALTALVQKPSEFITTSFYNADSKRHYHNHSPPLLSAQDTYLQNNVFRI